VAAAEQMRAAEARAREVEQQGKAEADRIRREAEAARETAVALARQQAEEQTRQKISAELDAERIAKSPGILIVTTSPVGASVSIDGGPARTAPLSINDILPGRHRVAISLAGYEPVELTADILGTKTTDLGLIQLERATGTLALNSTPEQLEFSIRPAGISLGGPLRQGRTPAQIDDLPPGDYVVTFSQPGWRDQVVNVTIEKRETAQIAAKFIGGAAMLTSVPTGAAVKRNGVVVGRTPLTLSELPPENASFEFSLPDHEPLVLSGDVVEGKQLKLEARLLHVDRIAPSSEIAVNPQPYEQPAPRIGATTAIVPPEVKVSFVVWRDGTPRDIQVLGKVDKDIAADCTTAVAKWKFHPARNRDGRPLNVRVTLPIKIVAENL
ncbi:MAG TPA: PEGA domain-containing protein, partial [Opitutus sp.]|nr:PEGA domain-containing protein [Opitutus sp.]